jgi:hypothetical protein
MNYSTPTSQIPNMVSNSVISSSSSMPQASSSSSSTARPHQASSTSSSSSSAQPRIQCFYPLCNSTLQLNSFVKHINRHLLSADQLSQSLAQDLIKYCTDTSRWYCNKCRKLQSQGHTCLHPHRYKVTIRHCRQPNRLRKLSTFLCAAEASSFSDPKKPPRQQGFQEKQEKCPIKVQKGKNPDMERW